jgi:hypothetical protein
MRKSLVFLIACRKSGNLGESKGYTIKSSSVINTQKAMLYRIKDKK